MSQPRFFAAPTDSDRCTADRKPLKDGSGARCMRKREPGRPYCSIHRFECCGGNDETPKDHCMDCPARSEEELRQAAINAGEPL